MRLVASRRVRGACLPGSQREVWPAGSRTRALEPRDTSEAAPARHGRRRRKLEGRVPPPKALPRRTLAALQRLLGWQLVRRRHALSTAIPCPRPAPPTSPTRAAPRTPTEASSGVHPMRRSRASFCLHPSSPAPRALSGSLGLLSLTVASVRVDSSSAPSIGRVAAVHPLASTAAI